MVEHSAGATFEKVGCCVSCERPGFGDLEWPQNEATLPGCHPEGVLSKLQAWAA